MKCLLLQASVCHDKHNTPQYCISIFIRSRCFSIQSVKYSKVSRVPDKSRVCVSTLPPSFQWKINYTCKKMSTPKMNPSSYRLPWITPQYVALSVYVSTIIKSKRSTPGIPTWSYPSVYVPYPQS